MDTPSQIFYLLGVAEKPAGTSPSSIISPQRHSESGSCEECASQLVGVVIHTPVDFGRKPSGVESEPSRQGPVVRARIVPG